MNQTLKVSSLLLSIGFALALPFTASAQVILFQDSFENDGTGYNIPNSSSNPAWNSNVDTGYVNTTMGDSNYDQPNSGPTQITAGTTPAGSDYLTLNNSGGAGDHDGPPYTDRTPSAQTDTITTLVSAATPTFKADSEYTLSVYIAGNVDPTLSASFSLLDGTTHSVVYSDTVQFGSVPDSNFHLYTFSFDTASDPSIVGDKIQIGLTAAQTSAQIFGRGASFDDVTLSVPEPSSWALMFAGLAMLVGFRFRSRSARA